MKGSQHKCLKVAAWNPKSLKLRSQPVKVTRGRTFTYRHSSDTAHSSWVPHIASSCSVVPLDLPIPTHHPHISQIQGQQGCLFFFLQLFFQRDKLLPSRYQHTNLSREAWQLSEPVKEEPGSSASCAVLTMHLHAGEKDPSLCCVHRLSCLY